MSMDLMRQSSRTSIHNLMKDATHLEAFSKEQIDEFLNMFFKSLTNVRSD